MHQAGHAAPVKLQKQGKSAHLLEGLLQRLLCDDAFLGATARLVQPLGGRSHPARISPQLVACVVYGRPSVPCWLADPPLVVSSDT